MPIRKPVPTPQNADRERARGPAPRDSRAQSTLRLPPPRLSNGRPSVHSHSQSQQTPSDLAHALTERGPASLSAPPLTLRANEDALITRVRCAGAGMRQQRSSAHRRRSSPRPLRHVPSAAPSSSTLTTDARSARARTHSGAAGQGQGSPAPALCAHRAPRPPFTCAHVSVTPCMVTWSAERKTSSSPRSDSS